eukprot:5040367-Alexandrium_andersonii.AAC.1
MPRVVAVHHAHALFRYRAGRRHRRREQDQQHRAAKRQRENRAGQQFRVGHDLEDDGQFGQSLRRRPFRERTSHQVSSASGARGAFALVPPSAGHLVHPPSQTKDLTFDQAVTLYNEHPDVV